MKKFFFTLLSLLSLSLLNAQDVPQGMKYQAVARDAKGQVIADKQISLKVTLFSGGLKSSVIHYSEVHIVKTNQVGLFSLEIGSGAEKSEFSFDKVPWSTKQIWMDVAVKENGNDFITISSGELMTVPYAFHSATAGKIDPTTDPEPVKEDRVWKWDNRCECHGGIREMTLLYLGPSGVKIRAYDRDDLRKQDLVDSFLNVQNGDVINLNAQPRPDHALKSKTWMQILTGNTATSTVISLIDMPSDCDTRSIGETFGNFSVLKHVDKKDGAVCSICDVRMEYKLDGNALFDACNWLGTKSHHDLRIITNNTERIKITKDQQVIIHDAVTVDQGMPTLLSGTLGVWKTTELHNTLLVYGPTRLQNSLKVNNISPTWLTGTLRVDGVTDLNSRFNVNLGYPTVLTGTLQTNGDVLFKQKVLLDNFNHESSSTTTGALVINGGLGIGKNFNIGGNAKFGGATEFQGVVTVTNEAQSTNLSTGALVISGGAGIGMRLNVGEHAGFGSTLHVAGITTLNNATQSNGHLNGALVVNGGVGIGKRLNVNGAAFITGNTTIAGVTNINNHTVINSGAGQVNITAAGSGGDQSDITAYPLTVTGANNGMWIKVNSPVANHANNFVTFQDGDGTINGRIEGLNAPDLENEQKYKNWLKELRFQHDVSIAQVVKDGILLVGALTAFTVCFGVWILGPAVLFCAPPPKPIVGATLAVIAAGINVDRTATAITDYITRRNDKLGVTYVSNGADYAEWLPKENPSDDFRPGDIVGVKGGLISRNTIGAEKLMVISQKPIILGNAPAKENEGLYKPVAFMGQVPVAVYGKVEIGDYIIASGSNDGFGYAVKSNELTVSDYKNLVGIAWSASDEKGIGYVNVAVGIGNDQVSALVERQRKKMAEITGKLNAQIVQANKTNEALAKLVPGFNAETLPLIKSPVIEEINPAREERPDPRFTHHLLTRQAVEDGIVAAEKMFRDQGDDLTKIKLFQNLKDPRFKEKYIDKFISDFEKTLKAVQKGEKIVAKELDRVANQTKK